MNFTLFAIVLAHGSGEHVHSQEAMARPFWVFLGRSVELILQSAPELLIGVLLACAVQVMIPRHRLHQWLGTSSWTAYLRLLLLAKILPLSSFSSLPLAQVLFCKGLPASQVVFFMLIVPLFHLWSIPYGLSGLGMVDFAVLFVASTLAAVFVGVWLSRLRDANVLTPSESERVTDQSSTDSQHGVLAQAFYILAGPFWLSLVIGVIGAGLMAAVLAPASIENRLISSEWSNLLWFIPVMLFGYADPTHSINLIYNTLDISHFPGIAAIILILGVGVNIGTFHLVFRHAKLLTAVKTLVLLCVATLIFTVALNMAWAGRPLGDQDSHAFDYLTTPYSAPTTHSEGASWLNKKLDESYTATSTVSLLCLCTLALVGALSGNSAKFRTWVNRVSFITYRQDKGNHSLLKRLLTARLPKSVFRMLALVLLFGAGLSMLYVYFPPPRQIHTDLRERELGVLYALDHGSSDDVQRELELTRSQLNQLSISRAIRFEKDHSENEISVDERLTFIARIEDIIQSHDQETAYAFARDYLAPNQRR